LALNNEPFILDELLNIKKPSKNSAIAPFYLPLAQKVITRMLTAEPFSLTGFIDVKITNLLADHFQPRSAGFADRAVYEERR
jgi:hypothetical protein